jgi:hypothetical protein
VEEVGQLRLLSLVSLMRQTDHIMISTFSIVISQSLVNKFCEAWIRWEEEGQNCLEIHEVLLDEFLILLTFHLLTWSS